MIFSPDFKVKTDFISIHISLRVPQTQRNMWFLSMQLTLNEILPALIHTLLLLIHTCAIHIRPQLLTKAVQVYTISGEP